MQIVYISNRPEILLETLAHVAAHMPFVDMALACLPDSMVDHAGFESAAMPVQLIAESQLLDSDEIVRLSSLEHQRRNYLLRSRLVAQEEVAAEFIMSDDDARPLTRIDPEVFIKNGLYQAYYFYSLSKWNNHRTSFDVGQLATFAVLNALGYPTRSFASHMPQIINKAIFLNACETFRSVSRKQPLCEWSSYFNYAICKHSEKFDQPCGYISLCWPENPLAWPQQIEPEQFLFENFTPHLYEIRQVFDGMPTAVQSNGAVEELAMEKVIRWRKYVILSRHPEQAPGLRKYLNWRTWINKLFKHLPDTIH